jgi:hypothetical protein
VLPPSHTAALYDDFIDISKYRLLLGFFLLYTDRVPYELLDSAALYEGRSAVEGGKQ